MKTLRLVLGNLYLLLHIPFTTALAQKLFNLEQCIEYALQHNIQIKQAEIASGIAAENKTQSRASQLPVLNASATHNYNYGRNVDPFTNQFTTSSIQSNNYSLTGSMVLFNGFQTRNNIKMNHYEHQAGLNQIQSAKDNVTLSVITSYLNVLYAHESLKAAQAQLELTEGLLQRTKKLVASGIMSEYSVLETEAQLYRERVAVVNCENQLQLAYLDLRQTMDMPAEDSLRIVIPENTAFPDISSIGGPKEIYETAVKNVPEIKYYEMKKMSAVAAWQQSKGRMSPRLSLNASLSTLYSTSARQITGAQINGYNIIGITQNSSDTVLAPNREFLYSIKPYQAQLRDNYNRFIGLSLSIPILNGWQTRTNIAKAKLSLINAEHDIMLSKRTLEKNIYNAHANAVAAFAAYKAAEKSLQSMQLLRQITERRVESGIATAHELSEVKTKLFAAETEFLKSKYDYLLKIKWIDYYKGVPIRL
ncbi:MAG: TolC family protein [Cytophagaceae bacterium]|nr:TolC family protein [Cytophagaceae bacterium]MDW8457128.1 TolC family protein [Cytophagaceae bacterium]